MLKFLAKGLAGWTMWLVFRIRPLSGLALTEILEDAALSEHNHPNLVGDVHGCVRGVPVCERWSAPQPLPQLSIKNSPSNVVVLADLPDRARVRVGDWRHENIANRKRESTDDREQRQEEGEDGKLAESEHHGRKSIREGEGG